MVKISSDEAFLILQKWHIDLTPVVLVGSLMPSNPLRGLIDEVWNSREKPAAIWGIPTDKQSNELFLVKV